MQFPRRLGEYGILEPLGRGGMGVVFRARHLVTGQIVALKTVRVARTAQIRGIRREIHALSRLRHPGIVRILAHGLHDGLPWYAMELLEGRTLREDRDADGSENSVGPAATMTVLAEEAPASLPTLDRPPTTGTILLQPMETKATAPPTAMTLPVRLPPPDSPIVAPALRAPVAGRRHYREVLDPLRVLGRLCSPLAFLHGEGLVHLDLKPANVLIQPNGWPVLLDFGLLSRFGGRVSRDTLTLFQSGGGSLAYMSPEQIRGDVVDPRSDLYSLGCILFEILTGRVPFSGDQPKEILQGHLHLQPPSPSAFVAGLPDELEQLVLRLLAKEPRNRVGYADDIAAILSRLGVLEEPISWGPRPRVYLYPPQFAGRKRAMRLWTDILDGLCRQKGAMLLIGGESGIGKTRLSMEFVRAAQKRGMRIFSGECKPPGERGDDFSGQRQDIPLAALRGPLRELTDLNRGEGMSEVFRLNVNDLRLLARYESSLRWLPGVAEAAEPEQLPPAEARQRLLSSVARVFQNLARIKPVLLVLDDLQWADELSIGYLELISRGGSLRDTPLLIVGTYRTEERSDSLDQLLAAPGVQSIELGRLDEQAVSELVGSMLSVPPPPLFSMFLSRHSEGNPFFAAEYLGAAIAAGLLSRDELGEWQMSGGQDVSGGQPDYDRLPLPFTIRQLVSRRLEGLSPAARLLAEIASVVGREVGFELLFEAAAMTDRELCSPLLSGASAMVSRGVGSGLKSKAGGLAEQHLFEATAELLRRRVFDEVELTEGSAAAKGEPPTELPSRGGPSGLRFLHDKIRECLYEEIPQQRRGSLHEAVALGIEQVHADDLEGESSKLATHWEQAGRTPRAAGWALTAARHLLTQSALEEAERFYRSFLKLSGEASTERVAALNELAGELLAPQGRNVEAIEYYDAAIASARELRVSAEEIRGLHGKGCIHYETGQLEAAQEHFEEALRLARSIDDRGASGRILSSLARLEKETGRFDEAIRLYGEALVAAREVGDQISEGKALGSLALLHDEQGRSDQAHDLLQDARVLLQRIGKPREEGVLLGNLSTFYLRQGEMDKAQQFLAEAQILFQKAGAVAHEGVTILNQAVLDYDQGRIAQAKELFEEALRIQRETGDRRHEAITLGNLGNVARDSGDFGRAAESYRMARNIAQEVRFLRFEGYIIGRIASLEHSQGRFVEAGRLYPQALEIHRRVENHRNQATILSAMATLARQADADLVRARELLDEAKRILEQVHDPVTLVGYLCQVGFTRLASQESATECLGEVRRLVTSLDAGPTSPVGWSLLALERAQQAFEAGDHHLLLCGQHMEEIREPLRGILQRRHADAGPASHSARERPS